MLFTQIGTGDLVNRNLPTLATGALSGKNINSVAACFYHTLAVDDGGNLYSVIFSFIFLTQLVGLSK